MPNNEKNFCPYDWGTVKQDAATRLREVLDHLDFPPTERDTAEDWFPLNRLRADKKPGSMRINKTTGAWIDHAMSGDPMGLGSVADLWADAQGMARGSYEVLQSLGDFLDSQKTQYAHNKSTRKLAQSAEDKQQKSAQDWIPILPVPDGTPSARDSTVWKAPTHHWEYRDINGKILGYVLRFNKPDGSKYFQPVTFCKNVATGEHNWQNKSFLEPHPLYKLQNFSICPDAPVMVCEGEKSTDAAQLLFPDFNCVTWPNGALSMKKANYSPLKGKRVLLWPDNDTAGKKAMQDLATLLQNEIGSFSVSIIDLEKLKPATSALPEKWDAADALAGGYTAEKMQAFGDALFHPVGKVLALVGKKKSDDTELIDNPPPPADWAPIPDNAGRFRMTDQGLLVREDGRTQYVKISAPFCLKGRICDPRSNGWRLLVSFKDHAGKPHDEIICMGQLCIEPKAIVAQLSRAGLWIRPKSEQHICGYLSGFSSDALDIVTAYEKTGWATNEHGSPIFILPDAVIGDASGKHMLSHSTPRLLRSHGVRGTLEGWQETVGKMARGNRRLMLGLCAAFAGPVLAIVDLQSGGFHIWASTSCGKTTIMRAALSVCGDPSDEGRFLSWSTTTTALELSMMELNDGLAGLDEGGQGGDFSKNIYLFANGQGRDRSERAAEKKKERHTFRNMIFSTGEKSIKDFIIASGENYMGGIGVRIIDIEAPVSGKTAFECLHGAESGSDFSQKLVTAAYNNYGHPIRALLCYLQTDKGRSEIKKLYADVLRDYLQRVKALPGSGGIVLPEIDRVVQRFAVTAAAGMYAAMAGIAPWEPADVLELIWLNVLDWMAGRGGLDAADDLRIIEKIRGSLAVSIKNRFEDWKHSGRAISNFLGWVVFDGQDTDGNEPDGTDVTYSPSDRAAIQRMPVKLKIPTDCFNVWCKTDLKENPAEVKRVMLERGYITRSPHDGQPATQINWGKRRDGSVTHGRVYVIPAVAFSDQSPD